MSTLETNEYEPDTYFRQPDGKVVQQELTTYELDNGIMISVPPFIESGDKIIIDTRSLEYVKKNK